MRSTALKSLVLSLLLTGLFGLSARAQTTVLSADSLGNPNGVTVVYSAAMDAASSTAAGNYHLVSAGGTVVPISSATLAADQVTVQLQLGASLQFTTNYTLTISNVKDATLAFISPNPTVVSFYFGGAPGGISFTFDDGLVPTNTSLATTALTDAINAQEAIAASGGFNNSGCLVLVSNATGQTYGQWQITNDLANGSAVSSFAVSFKLWMVNQDPAVAIGNGLNFHVGPKLPSQYTGGASSWGNGLDLNFRNFNNNIIPIGVNIWWYPPYTEPATAPWSNQGGGGTIPSALPFPANLVNLTTNWIGYIDTNGAAGGFSNYVNVNFSVSNGVANLICSNAQIGSTVLFSNVTIPTWTPIIGGAPGSGLPPTFGFTATDGSGNHQQIVLDDVDLTVNGIHVAGNGTASAVGPVGFTTQPVSVTTNENVYVTFNAGVTGAPPVSFQWFSNGVAIAGANAASYKTPLTLYSTMNGAAYSVAVSNNFSYVISSNAVLTLIRDTSGIQVASVGSVDGNSIGVLFTGYVDPATAGNPANYLVNGATPTAAIVRTAFANFGDAFANYAPAYLKTVRLTLASPVTGGYTVTVRSSVLSRTGLPVAQTNLTGTVAGLTDTDLVVTGPPDDPIAAGEAFSGGSNQVEIIAGGSDMMAISPQGFADHANWAYLARTGNFDMVAKLTWETPTMSAAKAGLMIRPSPLQTDPSSAALSETVFPSPGRNTYETAVRLSYGDQGHSWAAPGAPANGNLGASWPGGNWIRIRRVGPTFCGYASSTGDSWTLIGLTTLDTNNFPALEYIGPIACAANNDGRLCEADFSNWGPMSFPGAVVTITNNLKSSYVNSENGKQTFTIGASFSGVNVTAGDLVYQWQRKGPNDSVFSDIIDGTGNTNNYTTPFLTQLNDNGAQYRVIAFIGDITTGHSVTSLVATLTVNIDTVPPYVTSAYADATFLQLSINFDGPVDFASVYNAAYTIAPVGGGSPISITQVTPTPSADGLTYTNVILTLGSPLSPGVKYNLTVANVLDLAGNNINNTTVPGGKTRTFTGWTLAYGYLKYERWLNLPPTGDSTTVSTLLNYANYPNSPDVVELITYSGYPNGDISNPSVSITEFGSRISGFLIPPTNGNYNFYVRGNDGVALYVSPDSTRDNKVLKAAADSTAAQSWLYSITNPPWIMGVFGDTNAVPMTNGGLYYVELVHKQGTGTSYEEFTWGNPINSAMPALTSTTTAYGMGGRGGAPTNSYNITGTNIATWVNPDTSIITSSGPASATVQQFRSATFSVAATAVVSAGGAPSPVSVTYQWQKNGAAIVGATNATYTTPLTAYPGDNGASFGVVLSVPGLPFMTITNTATLTVTPDTTPPTVISVSSFGGTTIGIRYDWLVDPTTAANAANYAVSGLTVTRAQLRPDGQTVLLTLSGPLSGNTFFVTISNVKDLAGNTIAPNTVAAGNVVFPAMTALDIGVGTNVLGAGVVQTNATLTNVTFDVNFPGSVVMAQDGVFEVMASGQGFGTNNSFGGTSFMGNSYQDGLNFIYEQRTGDFDVKVRVERIDGSNARAKAGLMMRAGLAPGSLEYLIAVEPAATNAADGSGLGYNGVTLLRRQTNNDVVTIFAGNPNPPVLGAGSGSGTNMYPVWLRLRRAGSSFYVYTGADGTNWYLCGRATGQTAWPAMTYVGMATAAANKSSYTQARFAQYGNFVPPARPQVLLIGMDNNVTGSGPADTPAGNPNATNLWLRADTYMYNLFVGLGYNVIVVQDATARLEDATGMSLIFWDGTTSSGNLGGTPSTFTWASVPIIQAKDATLEKMGWVKTASDRGGVINQTTIKIVNTNNPIVKGLYQPNQNVQVNNNPQSFTVAITNNPGISGLAPGFTVVATLSTNTGLATIYYANPTTTSVGGLWWNNGLPGSTNYIAHRRVGLWLGDGNNTAFGGSHNGGNPVGDFSNITSDGNTLLMNAINWAVASTNEAPYITTQPAAQAVAAGQTAAFSVGVAGPGPYSYQWKKNGAAVGASYGNYITPATTLADSGATFQVVITGLYGSVTSAVATLTVQTPVAITSQPQSQTANAGSTATFNVTASGSSPGYQWYSNAVAIAGANSVSYTTPTLALANSGTQYYVVVTNLVSSATSATATLTVINLPVFSPPALSPDGHLTLTWTGGGILLQATNVTGPWTTNVGATSPYTFQISPSVPSQFFRIQQ